MRVPAALLLTMLAAASAFAADGQFAFSGVENIERAHANYMLHCQGCHGPHGEGNAAALVPPMRGFVGNFLKVRGGREFIVQVPGSAMAALDDARLAELLNWMLVAISAEELPADFAPYSPGEVGRLRADPAREVDARRAALVAEIGALSRANGN